MHLVGGGVTQDYAKSHKYGIQAARAGRPEAMARLGDIYHNALGIERDVAAAAMWWRKAADLGHTEGLAEIKAATAIASVRRMLNLLEAILSTR